MNINKILLFFADKKYFYNLNKIFKYDSRKFKYSKKIQSEKLTNILSHSIKNVPYYRDYFKKRQFNDLSDFPLVNKKIIRNNFNKFISEGIKKSRLKPNSTSGSTGENFYFYSDKSTDSIRHSFAHLGEAWAGAKFGDKKMIIWGADKDSDQMGFKKRISFSPILFNTKIISSYNISEDKLKNKIIPFKLMFNLILFVKIYFEI